MPSRPRLLAPVAQRSVRQAGQNRPLHMPCCLARHPQTDTCILCLGPCSARRVPPSINEQTGEPIPLGMPRGGGEGERPWPFNSMTLQVGRAGAAGPAGAAGTKPSQHPACVCMRCAPLLRRPAGSARRPAGRAVVPAHALCRTLAAHPCRLPLPGPLWQTAPLLPNATTWMDPSNGDTPQGPLGQGEGTPAGCSHRCVLARLARSLPAFRLDPTCTPASPAPLPHGCRHVPATRRDEARGSAA